MSRSRDSLITMTSWIRCKLLSVCSYFASSLRLAIMTVREKTPAEEQRERERELLPSVTLRGLHDAKRMMKAAEYRGKQHVAVRCPVRPAGHLHSCRLRGAVPS